MAAFEIGDGKAEEKAAIVGKFRRDNKRKSCPISDCPQKSLTEWGLSELRMRARAKAGKVGPGSNVGSSDVKSAHYGFFWIAIRSRCCSCKILSQSICEKFKGLFRA